MRRAFDIAFSAIILILTLPLFIILGVLIKLTSAGPVFFVQTRVGKGKSSFPMYKFRSMHLRETDDLKLTTGDDSRITSVGCVMRTLKLDELPQFVNVLRGEMTIVGYRPEVPEYVEKYEPWMMELFEYKPGLTDPAAIEYRNEPDLLKESEDPESKYISEIMPAKLRVSLDYLRNRSMLSDLKIILRTAGLVFGR